MAVLSLNETTTFRWSLEEDLANFAAAGIPAIGVWRQKLSDCGEARATELIERSGLKVSHLFWAGGFTGSDGRTYRQSVEDAADALRTAAMLKAQSLIVYSGGRAGHTLNHAKRLFREALVELSPLAAELNVTLAIEPMHPGCASQFTFLTAINDVLALLEAVGSRHVRLVLDTYHLGFCADLPNRIPEIIDRIALVQLGDGKAPPASGEQDRQLLGQGVVPLEAIVSALAASGYDGYYDVELIGESVESVEYPALIAHAKEAFQRLMRCTGAGR